MNKKRYLNGYRRTETTILYDRGIIKLLINQEFSDKEFTTSDIYYHFNNNWNKSKFGSIFNDLKALTKTGFLNYRIGLRKSGRNQILREGAIYTLNKN